MDIEENTSKYTITPTKGYVVHINITMLKLPLTTFRAIKGNAKLSKISDGFAVHRTQHILNYKTNFQTYGIGETGTKYHNDLEYQKRVGLCYRPCTRIDIAGADRCCSTAAKSVPVAYLYDIGMRNELL